MTSIRIILIDDHPVLVEGLVQLFELEPDFEVVAKCLTVADAVRAIATHRPDVVILDLKLRQESGLDLFSALREPGSPAVVVLTASDDEGEWLEAVRLGARGVVLKATAPGGLVECIRAVFAGRTWLTVEGMDLSSRDAHRRQVDRRLAERLTPREIEILRELASHRENDEIASRLGLSVGTVKLHAHHVYEKLGVSSRGELLSYLAKRKY